MTPLAAPLANASKSITSSATTSLATPLAGPAQKTKFKLLHLTIFEGKREL